MDIYSGFADVYDELMDNIPYDEWADYLCGLLAENNVNSGLVAELGCGTGNITRILSQNGYDMIGIDYSENMLDVARAKAAEDDKGDILYLCQDMREFELYGTVAAVVSICDSINYITDENDLLKVFKLVNNYLDPSGVFIFDFNTKHYYMDVVADATIAEDREDISFIWDNYYDEETDINELSLSLFIAEDEKDKLYRKYEELHLQKGYTVEKIKSLIEQSGLSFLNAYDAFTHDAPHEASERVYIVARETGKK